MGARQIPPLCHTPTQGAPHLLGKGKGEERGGSDASSALPKPFLSSECPPHLLSPLTVRQVLVIL